MADEVIIQHPTFTDQYYSVPADQASEWTDAGWVKANASDAPVSVGPPSGSPPKPPVEPDEKSASKAKKT